jgi:hypothetical protein
MHNRYGGEGVQVSEAVCGYCLWYADSNEKLMMQFGWNSPNKFTRKWPVGFFTAKLI